MIATASRGSEVIRRFPAQEKGILDARHASRGNGEHLRHAVAILELGDALVLACRNIDGVTGLWGCGALLLMRRALLMDQRPESHAVGVGGSAQEKRGAGEKETRCGFHRVGSVEVAPAF